MAIADALSLATIRSEALQATLNALTSAIYLTDPHGRIVYMNRAAERQAAGGNAIRVNNSHLVHIDHTAQLALARAIDEVIGGDVDLPINGRTIALLGGDNAGLIATIFPLGRGESQGSCGASRMAAIFVQEPMAMPFSGGEAFAELYGLTRSELRVLLAMAPGLSVREAADTLGISEATAKTHLQHIYSKTNTSKRAELMQLFMSSTPPVKSA
jgi:DNA-binding CsgD family transcriptional regulator